MKTLVALLTLAMLTAASAQHLPLPKTVTIVNNTTKEVIVTVTISDNRMYYRNPQGEHVATVEINADGTRSFYDSSGKPIVESPTVPGADVPK